MLSITIYTIASVLAFYFFQIPEKRWKAILIILGLICHLFNFVPDGNIKGIDFALILIILFFIQDFIRGRVKFTQNILSKCISTFIFFMIISSLFSVLYYHFTLYEVIQGGRYYYSLLLYYILIQLKPQEIQKIIRCVYKITLYASIIYLIQIPLKMELLTIGGDIGNSVSGTEFKRFYNQPFYLAFIFYLSLFHRSNFKVRWYEIMIFALATILALHRSLILATLISIIIGFWLSGGLKKKRNRYFLILTIVTIIPFSSLLSNRFESGNTDKDLALVLNGKYKDYNTSDSPATFAFRVALFMERFEYLSSRNLGEQIFGMGLISGSSPKVDRMYNFSVGLQLSDGKIIQLDTGDISWPLLIIYLGFAGTIIYIGIYLFSLTQFFHYKKNIYAVSCICYLISQFLISFTGSSFARPYFLFLPFLLLIFIKKDIYARQIADLSIKNKEHDQN